MTTTPEPAPTDRPVGAAAFSVAQLAEEKRKEHGAQESTPDPAAVPDPSVQGPDPVKSDDPY
jgi:hypothetical protein